MTERNKVIEALEACVLKDPDDSRDCKHCPRCNYGAFITNSCINGVMADALALLKAQEPIAPNHVEDGNYETSGIMNYWFMCGKCGSCVDPGDKYCHECGQAVKWE